MKKNIFQIVGDGLVSNLSFYNCTNWLDFEGYLVGFDTDNLDFGEERIPNLRFFPGGEWHSDIPVWSEGHHKEDKRPIRLQTEKLEVWALFYNRRLLVADKNNGLRLLTAKVEELQIVEPTLKEIAEYLYDRAVAMAKGDGHGLNWVRQSLSAIHSSARNDPVVKRYFDLAKRIEA